MQSCGRTIGFGDSGEVQIRKQKLVLHNQLVTSQLEAAADNSGLDICLGPLARPVLALDGGDLITHEALDDFLVG